MFFAEIILPAPGPTYTFSVSPELAGEVVVGSAVSVQFGVRQVVMGIVRSLSVEPPAGVERLKPVLAVLRDVPLVDASQLALWEWLADYYMCTLGEVFRSALPTLLRKGDFQPYKRPRKTPAAPTSEASFVLPQLSVAQSVALDSLSTAFRSRAVALLWGVPSSGKSEIAFHAAAATLARGEDVLLLLPEISLTTQFVSRVEAVFGSRVVLFHSGLTDRRRADAYLRLQTEGPGRLVVGTRSAIFLPFRHLGLVVVDEEQDPSYKQQDPAPRYNARDTAIVLARLHGAKTLLMSATPSLETWANAGALAPASLTTAPANAETGKYALVALSERFGDTLPPAVTISDTLRNVKRGERKSHFNKELLDRIGVALGRGEQVILFQNRRGVAPYLECPACSWVPRCAHCGIPMTVHRGSLRCHYCGATDSLPATCPDCGGDTLSTKGFGTEKIEDELGRFFPSARLLRLDRDSAGSEAAYRRIIGEFERGEADILVGTQMVTKGLDFAGVSLVGVLNADNLVNHPDFRASERAYHLVAQVAGRAGRRGTRGEVVIQTAAPDSALLAQAAAGDFTAMAAEQLAERATYGYPPYARLISILLRHRDRDTLAAAAARFRTELTSRIAQPTPRIAQKPAIEILGPQPPVTERVKGEFALLFLLKIPRAIPAATPRAAIAAAAAATKSDPAFRRVTITANPDPQ